MSYQQTILEQLTQRDAAIDPLLGVFRALRTMRLQSGKDYMKVLWLDRVLEVAEKVPIEAVCRDIKTPQAWL